MWTDVFTGDSNKVAENQWVMQESGIWMLTVQCTCRSHFGIWLWDLELEYQNLPGDIRPFIVIVGSASSVVCHARSYTAVLGQIRYLQLCPENTNTCVKAVRYSTSSMIPWLPELPAYRHWACLSFFALAKPKRLVGGSLKGNLLNYQAKESCLVPAGFLTP